MCVFHFLQEDIVKDDKVVQPSTSLEHGTTSTVQYDSGTLSQKDHPQNLHNDTQHPSCIQPINNPSKVTILKFHP